MTLPVSRLQLKCDGTRWRTGGEVKGNWLMEWVANTLHTTSEHGVSSTTTVDAHTSAASSWLNWLPCRFKWTRPFRRKTKSRFCTCAIAFRLATTTNHRILAISNELSWSRLRSWWLFSCSFYRTKHRNTVQKFRQFFLSRAIWIQFNLNVSL